MTATTLVRNHGPTLIDIHCHLLPGIDDGATDLDTSLRMAEAFVADGVTTVACTPHILPGLYPNQGPQIRAHVAALQRELDDRGIPLHLVAGADVHIAPDLSAGLRNGRILSLADSRYVLIEPPHHVMPLRLEDAFFQLLSSGYVPILTHPERLTWVDSNYDAIIRLVHRGTLLQLTSGSLSGAFGKSARYWAEKMLDDGVAHFLATDSHDLKRRPPNLAEGRELAAKRVGTEEAHQLVNARAIGVLSNVVPTDLAVPERYRPASQGLDDSGGGIASRLRRLFG